MLEGMSLTGLCVVFAIALFQVSLGKVRSADNGKHFLLSRSQLMSQFYFPDSNSAEDYKLF